MGTFVFGQSVFGSRRFRVYFSINRVFQKLWVPLWSPGNLGYVTGTFISKLTCVAKKR